MEWIVVKTLLSLAAVIALMVGVVVVMKKFVLGGSAASSNIVDMKVVGTLTLQPKRSVSVIKVMGKVIIVGISDEGMQTLGEITDASSLQHIDQQLADRSSSPGWLTRKVPKPGKVSFAEALGMQLSKLVAKGS